MTAGRPAKSLAQKIQDGTFRADRVNFNEPQPSPFDPTNPFDEDVDLYSFKLWEYVVSELVDRYSVGKGDRAVVEGYCTFYQRARLADEALERTEAEAAKPDQDPRIVAVLLKRCDYWRKLSESSWDRVLKFGAALGLDPVSRRKIRAPKAGPMGVVGGQQTLSLADHARNRELGPDDEEPRASTGDELLDSL